MLQFKNSGKIKLTKFKQNIFFPSHTMNQQVYVKIGFAVRTAAELFKNTFYNFLTKDKVFLEGQIHQT